MLRIQEYLHQGCLSRQQGCTWTQRKHLFVKKFGMFSAQKFLFYDFYILFINSFNFDRTAS